MTQESRGPGRRTRAEAELTRERLLGCVERLFANKGYRGVSLRELAKAANVRPFTIQYHFGSKLGLYKAVLGRWDHEVLECVWSGLKNHDDPLRVMEAIIDELFDLLLSKSDWVAA
jgi:AcrR family transcriptional regulator